MTFQHPFSAWSYTSERIHCVRGRGQGVSDIPFPSCSLPRTPNTGVLESVIKCRLFLIVICCVRLIVGFKNCLLPLVCDVKLIPVPVGMPETMGSGLIGIHQRPSFTILSPNKRFHRIYCYDQTMCKKQVDTFWGSPRLQMFYPFGLHCVQKYCVGQRTLCWVLRACCLFLNSIYCVCGQLDSCKRDKKSRIGCGNEQWAFICWF